MSADRVEQVKLGMDGMKNQWIKETCWNNEQFLGGKVRAVMVKFHGLGGGYRDRAYGDEIALAEKGVLVIAPYYGPWSWMNRQARSFVDRLLAEVYREFGFDDSIPLISSGDSMGGCSALLYCRYGARKPICCDALYPVCDAVVHFNERPDLPASFRHAFLGYPEPLDELLREHSPLHQIAHMPDIPYLLIHGDADLMVNKELHSDRMVEELRRLGRDVEYVEVPRMGHGVNIPLSVPLKRLEFVTGML